MNKYQSAYRFIESCVEPWQIIGNEDNPVKNTQRWDCMNILKELVDKATPSKPEYEGDGYANGELVYDSWICPNCKTRYEVDYDDYDYCPNCGQRIERK